MRKAQLACCFVVVSLFATTHFVQAADPAHPEQSSVPPAEAISRLKEGNGRFTSGNPQHPHESSEERTQMSISSHENLGMSAADAAKRREELANAQHPFAVIVGCADSRVPT